MTMDGRSMGFQPQSCGVSPRVSTRGCLDGYHIQAFLYSIYFTLTLHTRYRGTNIRSVKLLLIKV